MNMNCKCNCCCKADVCSEKAAYTEDISRIKEAIKSSKTQVSIRCEAFLANPATRNIAHE